MNQYEFASVPVKSESMRLILEELREFEGSGDFQGLVFFIVGLPGTGRSTMAHHIGSRFFLNQELLVLKDLNSVSKLLDVLPRLSKTTGGKKIIVTVRLDEWPMVEEELAQQKGIFAKVIRMPCLGQRRADIPELADFSLKVLCHMNGWPPMRLTEKAREMVVQYHWPGQFIELDSVLENAAQNARLSSTSPLIDTQHLELNANIGSCQVNVGMTLEEIERNFILQTLYFSRQNRTKAAQLLGISIRTLRNKLTQYRQEGHL